MRLPLIAVALALSGCGGVEVPHAVTQETQAPVGLARYRTVFVEVSSEDPELQEGVLSLKSALLGRLSTLGCFDNFVTGVDPRGADLHLSAVLTGGSTPGGAEQVLLGGLAERPRVTVDVRLVDLGTRALVGRFQVEGAASGSSASVRAAPEAFENAGVGIADYIHEHR